MLSSAGPLFQSTSSTQQQQGQQQSQQQPQQQQQQQQQQHSRDSQLDQLVNASRTLEERLVRDDRCNPELSDLLLSNTSSDYSTTPSPAWSPFVQRAVVSLPESLLDESLDSQGSSPPIAKILPEINRVCFTIENRLFLWDYIDGNQLVSYDGLQDYIFAADLVKPKPGVFVDNIKHVLVICLPFSVKIMVLAFQSQQSQQQQQDSQLQQQQHAPSSSSSSKIPTMCDVDLSADTRGVEFHVTCGTHLGRIFLGGNDGHLYELDYRIKDTLFASRCSLVSITGASLLGLPKFLTGSKVADGDIIEQIVHDHTRNLIYVLHASSTIQVFHLGPNGQDKPTLVSKYSTIKRDSLAFSPRSTPALDHSSFKIISISAITTKESRNLGLVAITSTAVRIYFSLQPGGLRAFGDTRAFPSTFVISHIRFPPVLPQHQQGLPGSAGAAGAGMVGGANAPPGTAPSAFFYNNQPHQTSSFETSQRPLTSVLSGCHTACGFFVAANAAPSEAFCAVPESSRIVQAMLNNQRPSLLESSTRIEIHGKARAVVENLPLSYAHESMNELSTQVTSPRREFLVLTENGMTFLARNRPVDVLIRLLEGGSTRDQEIRLFFESYGYDESLAMCLMIASGLAEQPPSDSSNNASYPYSYPTSRYITTDVVTTAKRYISELGGRPTLQGIGLTSGTGGVGITSSLTSATGSSKVQNSFRHDGLASTFARLVRPIWKSNLTVRGTGNDSKRQASKIPAENLAKIQKNLLALQSFTESEQHILMPGPDQYTDRNALQAEYNSMIAIRLLLTQFIEALSFVMLLIEFQLPEVIAACTEQQQNDLLTLTYQELLTTAKGRDMARNLVSAMINHQINQGLSVDAISDVLQGRCGSFCSPDDVLLHKAAEHLRKALTATEQSDRSVAVRESLRLFTKASNHLSLEKLRAVCTEYQRIGFNYGAIELALHCAEAWDKDNNALLYFEQLQQQKNQKQQQILPSVSRIGGTASNLDGNLLAAYETRLACYKLVFSMLETADDLLDEAYKAGPGQSSSASVEEAEKIRSAARSRALNSNDQLFHFRLYEWFFQRGHESELLSIQSSFVKPYLLQEPMTRQRYDLLWQYYVQEGSYLEAGQVVAALAENKDLQLTIMERMQYLSMAVTQVKAQSPSNVSRAELSAFLTSIEEKRDVAQVQVEIFSEIDRLDLNEQVKTQLLEELELRLYNITELYSGFAEPYDMYEAQLYIFHVSDHHDPERVQQLWELVIDQTWSGPEGHRLPKLRSKVAELVRRFYPSDAVLPLGPLVSLLEEHSLTNILESEVGWVPLALRDGSVPFDKIFEAFDVLFRMRVPPWQSQSSIAFLAANLTVLLEKWYQESRSAEIVGTLDSPQFPVNGFESLAEQLRDALDRGQRQYPDLTSSSRKRLDDLQRRVIKEF